MFHLPSALYFSACLGSLFLSILCTCCSHFFWCCFISLTIFCAPVFSLMRWFSSLSNFVIPSQCLKNFIFAASKLCSSLFFNTQASLPNFNADLVVMLWILNFVSLFICFPKCLRIAPFILLYVCISLYQFLLVCYNHEYKDCDPKKLLGLFVVFMSVYCLVSYRNILKNKRKYPSLCPVTVSPNHSALWKESLDVNGRNI